MIHGTVRVRYIILSQPGPNFIRVRHSACVQVLDDRSIKPTPDTHLLEACGCKVQTYIGIGKQGGRETVGGRLQYGISHLWPVEPAGSGNMMTSLSWPVLLLGILGALTATNALLNSTNCLNQTYICELQLQQRKALEAFYWATGGPLWANQSGWDNPGAPPNCTAGSWSAINQPDHCNWNGVGCVGEPSLAVTALCW